MRDIFSFFEKPRDPLSFSALRISLASPEKIREWSRGEVKKPETINYRTFTPERDGLFCAKIFGPVKDYECNCGKYKRMKHRGIVCEKCGVEVIQSKVRRERLGHINLAAPVAHIWFFEIIGNILDISLKNLEKVLYCKAYIVIDPKDTTLVVGELLCEGCYDQMLGVDHFEAVTGGGAILEMLERVDVHQLAEQLRVEMRKASSEAKRRKTAKRLKVVEAFRESGNRPEWMMLTVIPVLPPDLRPLVPLDGGRFATSDLNDLYRRVINRNNRLKRLLELNATEFIIRNERRSLQEAVDALFDNGRCGKTITGSNKRPLKSLSAMLKDKQGRFHQNLLGKRVDYSGRSVIVVGPTLRLHQCGLPKKMALELFKPFIYNKLEERGYVNTIKSAKKMVEKERPEVWDILEEVISEHPVMLNRAPTLHRLGIQAFEPVLIEGKAIQLHPLVCTAFNADFDGDQMAVHVPLSVEAQMEARVLMMSTNNILSPAHGKPIIDPTQDIVLGLHYLTSYNIPNPAEPTCELFPKDIENKLPSAKHITRKVWVKSLGTDGAESEFTLTEAEWKAAATSFITGTFIPDEKIDVAKKMPVVEDERGREAFKIDFAKRCVLKAVKAYQIERFGAMRGFYSDMNDVRRAYDAGEALLHAFVCVRHEERGEAVERGTYTTTVGRCLVSEILPPKVPFNLVNKTLDKKALSSLIDATYRLHRNKETVLLVDRLRSMGFDYATRSGASLSGLGGDLTRQATASVSSNWKLDRELIINVLLEGSVAKQAEELTRKIIQVSQGDVICIFDCRTVNGVTAYKCEKSGETIQPFADLILGRVLVEDVVNPLNGETIAKAGNELDEKGVHAIEEAGVEEVRIRSVLTCEARRGICALCYGRDLARGSLVNVGEAVGIVAAQSIGESWRMVLCKMPRLDAKGHKAPRILELFEARNPKKHAVVSEIDGEVSFGKDSGGKRKVVVTPFDQHGNRLKNLAREYLIAKGKPIQVHPGDRICAGGQLTVGPTNPHDILRVKGDIELAAWLVNEIQQVYRLQGVGINDKHIEVIVRQMLRRVRIKEVGDTNFLVDEPVEKNVFERENRKVIAQGLRPATAEPLLLGITKASLSTDSFISASSFQETTKVLTEAAISGKQDDLLGIKENVIMGRLIPAGTGISARKGLRIIVEDGSLRASSPPSPSQ